MQIRSSTTISAVFESIFWGFKKTEIEYLPKPWFFCLSFEFFSWVLSFLILKFFSNGPKEKAVLTALASLKVCPLASKFKTLHFSHKTQEYGCLTPKHLMILLCRGPGALLWIPGKPEQTGKTRKGRFYEWSKKRLTESKTDYTTRKSIKITCSLILFVAFRLICFILLNDKK